MSEIKKINILTSILGDYHRSGGEYLFKCPKCSHHKKKLSVNLDKNCYKCWICEVSGKNITRLVRRYGEYNHYKQWAEFEGIVDLSAYEDIFKEQFIEEEVEEVLDLPGNFISLCNKDASISSLSAKRYLKERGITKADILKWKIGYCPVGEFASRIVVPSYNSEGDLNYYVARTYDNRKTKKYMNPNAKKDIIFNELYVDWSTDVIIVEGVFDAIKAGNAVPLLGSTLRENSKLFKQIVRNDSAIYLALDPDAERKTEKLINSLLKYDIEIYKIPIPLGKDVGDMSHEEFLECKKQAKLFRDTDDVLLRKIMSI